MDNNQSDNIVMYNGQKYLYSEDEQSVYLNAIDNDEDGFKINLTFTKDQKEHDESIKVIKEFFIKEIL
jgi:hypothetical protein